MEVTSLYDFTQHLAELQSRFQVISKYPAAPLKDYLENMSSQVLKMTEIQQTAMPDLSWLNIYLSPTSISQSSQYMALDSEDGINEECISIDNSDDASSGRIVQRTSKDSTSSADINRMNEEFYSSLLKRTQTFVWTLKHTDFEDGVENDIIKEVEGYIRTNKFVTYLWLHSIYSNNQKDVDVLAGLLRIIGMTVENDDTDMLLTMVKAGLSDSHSQTQEAALMVIEQWRTQNCLTIIETAPAFTSSWIRDYAEQIKLELKEEMISC